MSTDESLNLLIAKAGAIAGSEYKLAKVLGMPQQNISAWKIGKRTCTPEDRARLAGVAREDAVQELIRATLEKTKGTLRGEQLYRLLGKSLQATGAASVTVLPLVASLTYGISQSIRCILSLRDKRHFAPQF